MNNEERPWTRTAGDAADAETPVVSVEQAPQQAERLTVVVDAEGLPRWLVGPDGPAPVLVVAPDRLLGEVLSSEGVLSLLAAGVPALVVVDAGRVTGTIAMEDLRVVLAAMNDAGAALSGTLDDGVDFTLAGAPRPPDRIRVWCGVCGALNELEEPPQSGQTCVTGGHPLQPEWR